MLVMGYDLSELRVPSTSVMVMVRVLPMIMVRVRA